MLRPKSGATGAERSTLIRTICCRFGLSGLCCTVTGYGSWPSDETVPELLLVIGDSVEGVEKTFAVTKILKDIGAYADLEKAKDSHAFQPGRKR